MQARPMPDHSKPDAVVRGVLVAAGLVIVIAGMREAQSILLPFLISVFLAVVGAPPMLWLKRVGVPASLAVLLIVAGMVGLGFGLGALIGTSVNDFSTNLPGYQARLQQESSAVIEWFDEVGVDLDPSLVFEFVNPGAAMSMAARTLTGLGSVFTNAFLILLTVVFMLLEASSLPAKLRRAFGEKAASFPQFSEFTDSVKGYMAIKTAVSLATGLLIGGWVWVLGVDFALLWGLLAFLLNYIPNIGSIIAAVPAVLLALIQFGLGKAVIVAVGFLAVNFIMGSIVEPQFMGRELGLSTLVVFLSLVFWGWVWGAVGMLLSVPLTMTVKIALESHEDTHWIAVLLGPEAEAKASKAAKTARAESAEAG